LTNVDDPKFKKLPVALGLVTVAPAAVAPKKKAPVKKAKPAEADEDVEADEVAKKRKASDDAAAPNSRPKRSGSN
jgi:hypothetical protein